MLCFYLMMCVQIIVESFPVSSSGHCNLLMLFLKNSDQIFFECTDFISRQGIYSVTFIEAFDHMLHAVTVALLALFFFNRWKIYFLRMRLCMPIIFRVIGLVVIADSITALFYYFFKLYPVQLPLVIGFSITAISLLSLYFISGTSASFLRYIFACAKTLRMSGVKKCTENSSSVAKAREDKQDERKCKLVLYLFNFYSRIKSKFSSPLVLSVFHLDEKCNEGWRSPVFTPSKAIILGLVQGLALLPGISRLATTYAAARWLGLQPRKAFEVSWLIAVPLFVAASMQALYKLWYMPQAHALDYAIIPYMLCAGLIAYGALKLTAHLFYTGRGWWFGVYMLLPICLMLSAYAR